MNVMRGKKRKNLVVSVFVESREQEARLLGALLLEHLKRELAVAGLFLCCMVLDTIDLDA